MFSRTTIASSIRIPIASERPSSDIVLSVNPHAYTATKLATTETGSAIPVMTVERHELRNRNTTSTVSSAPSISVPCTFETLAVTRSPESLSTVSVMFFGSVCRSFSTFSITFDVTSVVLYPLDRVTSRPTASTPSSNASVRCSSVPAWISASWPRRIN